MENPPTPKPEAEPQATSLKVTGGRQEGQEAQEEYKGSAGWCIGLGLLFLAAGAWFLVVDPTGGEVMGRSIVNSHKVTLGQTAAIVGAIFLAAGIRPR
jgi:hypothetical protein